MGLAKGKANPLSRLSPPFTNIAFASRRSGARGNSKPKPCSTCDGKGWTTFTSATTNRDRMHVNRGECRDCKGAGERLKEKEKFVLVDPSPTLGSTNIDSGVKNARVQKSSPKRTGRKCTSREACLIDTGSSFTVREISM